MKTAFVAGATGYTGREVVRWLSKEGIKTYAHVRPDSPRLAEWKHAFQKMGALADTTSWTLEAFIQTLHQLKPDFVFALLGTTRARMKQGENTNYESIDYGLTHLLLEACLRLNPQPKFIYLSSIIGARVAPSTGKPDGASPSTRLWRWLGRFAAAFRGDYLKVRWKMEEEIRKSGLHYVIARPSFITGPDRDDHRPLERYGSWIIDQTLGAAGKMGFQKLNERYRSTTNTILAKALVTAALNPALKNQILESEKLR